MAGYLLGAAAVRGRAGGRGLRALETDWRTREPRAGRPRAGSRDDARSGRPGVRGAHDRAGAGMFGVHTWVAVKPAGARATRSTKSSAGGCAAGGSALVIRDRHAGRALVRRRARIDRRHARRGARSRWSRASTGSPAPTPGPGNTRVWPGPNSNTFTAWILRGVPELKADLPPTAIGKDYTGDTLDRHRSERERASRCRCSGCSALTASGVEGLELNLLGLPSGSILSTRP